MLIEAALTLFVSMTAICPHTIAQRGWSAKLLLEESLERRALAMLRRNDHHIFFMGNVNTHNFI